MLQIIMLVAGSLALVTGIALLAWGDRIREWEIARGTLKPGAPASQRGQAIFAIVGGSVALLAAILL